MKTVYQLDRDGVYLGETIAQESPLEPGVFLMPAGCIEHAPPPVKAGKFARWDGSWTVENIPEPPKPDEPPKLTEAELERITTLSRLAELDRVIPRSVEDLYAATNTTPHPSVQAVIDEKILLRGKL
jgi:hypothetical protein